MKRNIIASLIKFLCFINKLLIVVTFNTYILRKSLKHNVDAALYWFYAMYVFFSTL